MTARPQTFPFHLHARRREEPWTLVGVAVSLAVAVREATKTPSGLSPIKRWGHVRIVCGARVVREWLDGRPLKGRAIGTSILVATSVPMAAGRRSGREQ